MSKQRQQQKSHIGRQSLRYNVSRVLIALSLTGCVITACGSPEPELVTQPEEVSLAGSNYYGFGPASVDGIGKFYLGREISHVMGHRGAAWLERPTRQQEERTDLLIDNLPLSTDSVVADIGAGTGYFSLEIAKRVPAGKVFAVDIQQEMLDIIETRKSSGKVRNIRTILGTERDPTLPQAAVDIVLIVDAYHEFSYPREMGEAIARALKPGGKLVLIEYRGEDPSVAIKPLHKMAAAQAIKEMAAVGLEWERTEDFLPQQHFLVFRRPGETKSSQN